MAEKSLSLACTFAAACQTGVHPENLRAELCEWWAEHGHDCFLSQSGDDSDAALVEAEDDDHFGEHEDWSRKLQPRLFGQE